MSTAVPKWVERRVRILIAIALLFVGFLCVGPSELLSFPDSILLMALGQMLAGISGANCSSSASLLEMIDDANTRIPNNYLAVAGASSGLYRALLGCS